MIRDINCNQPHTRKRKLKLNDTSIRRRVPIRRRVLKIVLLTTLVGIVAAGIFGMACIRWIERFSEATFMKQLEGNIQAVVRQKAVSADARLEHYEKYITLVTDYIENMYLNEEEMVDRGRIYYGPSNTHEYELTRMLANEDVKAEDLSEELLFFSNLEQVWKLIAEENEDLISTVYAGTTVGLLTSYDRWSYLSYSEDSDEAYYDYFQSDWYSQGKEESGIFYTDLYVDSQGRGLTITIASPFRDEEGRFMGVDCADFDITGLYNELLNIDLGKGAFTFTMDEDGVLISPDADKLSVEEITQLSPDEMKKFMNDSDGIIEIKDAVYVRTNIERIGWTLCACVPKEIIHESIEDAERAIHYAIVLFMIVVGIIIIIEIIVVNHAVSSITYPMELLGQDMKIISEGDMNYRAKVYRNDEIGDITSRLNEMVDRLNITMRELMNTQQHADAMSRLATRDALTGIRNKTAYDNQIRLLQESFNSGNHEFGFVMVDLNNLKTINDSYGHDKGDIAIKKCCRLICETFTHSPVFRIGGDEFVIVLRESDYRNIDVLLTQFKKKVSILKDNIRLQPWERVSAAIGYALYDDEQDTSVQSVLARADQEMYKNKKKMKQSG